MHSSRPVLWIIAPVAAALVWCAGARAERVAVFQVEGPGLLPAAREELENQVRLGLKDAGVDVQDAAATAGFVKDAAAAGLACSLAEEECALKVAVAADVDGVVIGRTVSFGGKSALELSLATLDGRHARVAGSDDARALARRLKEPTSAAPSALPVPLLLEPEDAALAIDGRAVALESGVVWLLPGAHTLAVSQDGHEPRVVPLEVSGDRLPPSTAVVLDKSFPVLTGVGLVTAGGGVVVTVLFGILTLGVEGVLAAGVTAAEVDGARQIGQVLLGITCVGAAATGVGATLAVVGGLE